LNMARVSVIWLPRRLRSDPSKSGICTSQLNCEIGKPILHWFQVRFPRCFICERKNYDLSPDIKSCHLSWEAASKSGIICRARFFACWLRSSVIEIWNPSQMKGLQPKDFV
jgi:hypothetical protein